jgi:hypothetical protein
MQNGSRFFVSVDGKLDAEAQDIDVKYNGDPVPLVTMTQDVAGYYYPPKSAVVSVKGVLMANAPSVDYADLFLTGKIVDVYVRDDNNKPYIRAAGVVNAPSFSSSMNDGSRFDISLHVQASRGTPQV